MIWAGQEVLESLLNWTETEHGEKFGPLVEGNLTETSFLIMKGFHVSLFFLHSQVS